LTDTLGPVSMPWFVAELLGRSTEESSLSVGASPKPSVNPAPAGPARPPGLWQRFWTRLTSEQAYNEWVDSVEHDPNARKVPWRRTWRL
jgi:hypothetical protein